MRVEYHSGIQGAVLHIHQHQCKLTKRNKQRNVQRSDGMEKTKGEQRREKVVV